MTIYTTPPEPDANKPVTPASGVGPPVGGSGSTAERFVSQELIQAKKSLQAVRIGGTLFLVFVGGYLYYLTSTFVANMRPHDAAEIAFGIVNQQVEDKGPDLVSQLKQKVPEYIAQTPDYALQQLPKYRTTLEDRVEANLDKYCKDTSQQLGMHLDTYLDKHKDEMKGLLTAANDPVALKQMGDGLKQELTAYLQEKPATGESLSSEIDKSLSSLQEVSRQIHHLAYDKGLKPEEQKTRRALAILSSSIDKQDALPKIPLDKIPGNQTQPAGDPTAPAPADPTATP